MIYLDRWKIWLVAIVSLYAVFYALPNLIPADTRASWAESMPSWAPQKTVNLGLDLQGGSHLLLRVEMDKVLNERLDSTVNEIRTTLRKERIGYVNLKQTQDSIRFTLRDKEDADEAEDLINDMDGGFDVDIDAGGNATLAYTDEQRNEMRKQIISQSIEIVRRRIDETGTKEPVIQAQGDDRILVQLPGIDDPERVKDLLGKTAKLSFNLVNDAVDLSKATAPAGARILSFQENPAQKIAIDRRALITGEMLVDSQPTFQDNEPVVSFRFDSVGSRRFCDVTSANVGKPFAIVLDGEVISAPVIRDAICGGSGIISGGFTTQDANDLSLLLRAGALPAPLTVIEERTVGPSLGADSIEAGEKASILALIAVLVFMVVAYGLFGLFASLALVINIFLIFALLSSLQAT